MLSVTKAVQDCISQNLFLQEAINLRIVSYNKLAEYIKPEIEEAIEAKTKISSIAMAIRRHIKKIEAKQIKFSLGFFRETLLKTDICYIIIEESPTALNKLQGIYNKMDLRHGLMFHIVHANYEIGIITNQRVKQMIIDELSDEKIIRVVGDLVTFSLTFSKDFLTTLGVIYYVTRFLTFENINIFSIWITLQELNLLVSRNDMMKTHHVLDKLIKTSKS
jgi:hypothetical protein